MLGGAELVVRDVAVGRIVEQAHERDRLAIERSQLRCGHAEAERERTREAIAQRHHGVEIGLDRGPKTFQLRPPVDTMQRLASLHVGIIGGEADAEIEAFLEIRPVARVHGLMQRDVAAVVVVDANLQTFLDRQPEERRGGREGAVDRGHRNAVIDELERSPASQCGLEIPRHGFVGAGLTADDRCQADNGDAHLSSLSDCLFSLVTGIVDFADFRRPDKGKSGPCSPETLAMKIAVPDLISNSYFPAIAAVELGFFKREGLDVALEMIVPVENALAAMREGTLDFIGCSAHLLVAGFPEWQGVKLLCAQAQGMYWFLVMRADLGARRGDLEVVKGRSIGAAHWVGMGLRRLLIDAGIDPERDGVTIAPIPGAHGAGINFGVTAAKALADGRVDGFWANGMGAALAVESGVGTIVLDARRGDGPPAAFGYTMAAIAATDALIARSPDKVAAAVRAIVNTQRALKADVTLAREVGRKLFPATEAELIVDLVRSDLPYYDPSISPAFVTSMTQFSRDVGILTGHPTYEQAVAAEFAPLWKA